MTAIYSLYLLTSFFPKGFLTQWSVCTALSSPESWEPLFMRRSCWQSIDCVMENILGHFVFSYRVPHFVPFQSQGVSSLQLSP